MNSSRTPLIVGAFVVLGLVVAYLVVGGGDAQDPSSKLLSRIPADANVALLIPHHRGVLAAAIPIVERASKAFPGIKPLIANVGRKAGFDPLKPETLAKTGLDPEGGMAFALGKEWGGLWFSITEPEAFRTFIRKKVADADAEKKATWEEKTLPDGKLELLSLPNHPAAVAMAIRGDMALVVPARTTSDKPIDAAAVAQRLLGLDKSKSLETAAVLKELRGKMKTELPIWCYTTGGFLSDVLGGLFVDLGQKRNALAMEKTATFLRGSVVGLELNPLHLGIRFINAAAADKAPLLNTAWTPARPGPAYPSLAPADTLLLTHIAFNAKGLLPFLRKTLFAPEREAMDKALAELDKSLGLEIEAGVLPALSGHLGFAFHSIDLKSGVQKLLSKFSNAPELAMGNPGAIATTSYVGLADSKAILALVEAALAKAAASDEYEYQVERLPNMNAWRLATGGTEVAGLAIDKDVLIFTTGRDRLNKALNRKPGDPTLEKKLVSTASRAAIDPSQNAGLLISVPVLLENFPILNLLPAVSKPARQLGELTLRTRYANGFNDGSVTLSLKPVPPPTTAKNEKKP